LTLAVSAVSLADLGPARGETNSDRKVKLALEAANPALDAARKGLNEGRLESFTAGLKEAREAVDLAHDTALQMGRSGRRPVNTYKDAEQRLGKLLRRLESLIGESSGDDKVQAEALKVHFTAIRDQLVTELFAPKKRK